MARVRDVLNHVERKLSMIDGVSVQQYAEPRILDAINERIRDIARRDWFPQFMQWFERELDGQTGMFTVRLDDVRDYRDIRAVFTERYPNTPLPYLPQNVNPFDIGLGVQPWYIEWLPTEQDVRVWPKTATGKVYVHARVIADSYDLNDVVPVDDHLIASGVAYMMAEDDGANPGQIQKFQQEFEERLRRLQNDKSERVPMHPYIGSWPTTWWP